MKRRTRVLTASAILLALACWFLAPSGAGNAADEEFPTEEVLKLAGMIEKKDTASAKKQAAAIAKAHELDEVMHLFTLRQRKGLGVGDKPGAITPDGIEAKIMALGKKPLSPKEVGDQAQALEKMGYVAAAIASVAQQKPPAGAGKDWEGWASDMRQGALALAEAAKKKNAMEIKATAIKLDANCNTCHEKYK